MKRQTPVRFKKVTLWDNFDLEKIVELTKFLPEPLKREDIVNRLLGKKYWIKTTNDETNRGIGFSIWYEFNPTEVYYWITVTHPQHSKRRIGERLLKSAIAISQMNNYPKFSLTTYNQCHGMIHLCRKLGLREGEWKRLEKPYGRNRYSIEFSCDLQNYNFPPVDKKHTLKIPAQADDTGDILSCGNPEGNVIG